MTLQEALSSAVEIQREAGECAGIDCEKCFRKEICRGNDYLNHDYKGINLRAAERFIAAQGGIGIN